MSLTDVPARGPARRGIDAVTVLSGYIVLLMAVPAQLVFAPLGGAGSPAQVLGLGALVWWASTRLLPQRSGTGRARQLRRALLLFAAAVLLSYVAANIRPLDAVESRAADRGLLILGSWCGLLLLTTDGVATRDRLDNLLRRLTLGGGLLASLGILQSFTGLAFTNYIHVPGLSANSAYGVVMNSRGFARPAGTALHPIEFGVVLTMILPLALHYALEMPTGGIVRRWFPVAAIALAVPISISRSAILGAVVVLVMLMPTWPSRRRRTAYVSLVGLFAVVYVTVPGLLGTLKGLFGGISSDSSALSRTGSYQLAGQFIARAPVTGRGFSTFLPSYRILDNQYLGILIELGVVGLAAVLLLFLSGVLTARAVRQDSRDPVTRQLAQSVAASIAAGCLSFALFDAFSFPMVSGLMFLMLGLAGALRELDGAPRVCQRGMTEPEQASSGGRVLGSSSA